MSKRFFPIMTIAILSTTVAAGAESYSFRQHGLDYGDTVTAMDSESFVICSGCKADALVKLPKQYLAIKAPNEGVEQAKTSIPESSDVGLPDSPPFVSAPCVMEALAPVAKKPSKKHAGTVLFRFDSAVLQKKDKVLLDKIAAGIQGATPDVDGYTCTIGAKGHNNDLSAKRARAVASYLRTKGVDSVAEGKGSCCAVSKDKKLNRRVDIEITVN